MADSTANLSKLKEEENKNEELLKQFMESQEELDRLNSGVLPFGWSYFPFGPSSPKPWSRTRPGFQTDPCSKAWQIWGDCSQMLAAIFGGWYNVFGRSGNYFIHCVAVFMKNDEHSWIFRVRA